MSFIVYTRSRLNMCADKCRVPYIIDTRTYNRVMIMKIAGMFLLMGVIVGCASYKSDIVRNYRPELTGHDIFYGNIAFHEDFGFHVEVPRSRLGAGFSHSNSWGMYIGGVAGAIPAMVDLKYFFPGLAVGYALQAPVSFLCGYSRPEIRLMEEYYSGDYIGAHQRLIAAVNESVNSRRDDEETQSVIVWECGLGNEFPPFPFFRLFYYIVYSDAHGKDFYVLRSDSQYSLKVWLQYFEKLTSQEVYDPDVGWFFKSGKRLVLVK